MCGVQSGERHFVWKEEEEVASSHSIKASALVGQGAVGTVLVKKR